MAPLLFLPIAVYGMLPEVGAIWSFPSERIGLSAPFGRAYVMSTCADKIVIYTAVYGRHWQSLAVIYASGK